MLGIDWQTEMNIMSISALLISISIYLSIEKYIQWDIREGVTEEYFTVDTSVVSKYSLDRVLTCEFHHFDTHTHSYLSSFHKTSNEWVEF